MKSTAVTMMTFCILLAGSFSAAPVKAADLKFPVQCYQSDELNRLQSWEAQWAGKKNQREC